MTVDDAGHNGFPRQVENMCPGWLRTSGAAVRDLSDLSVSDYKRRMFNRRTPGAINQADVLQDIGSGSGLTQSWNRERSQRCNGEESHDE